jgi:hypothetical protein
MMRFRLKGLLGGKLTEDYNECQRILAQKQDYCNEEENV